MKIPAQQKIAELEGRISLLEQKVGLIQKNQMQGLFDRDFSQSTHWKKMWSEFNQLMREVFHGRP